MIVIPAIDLKRGKCVRLYRGQFDRVTEYSDDPCRVAHEFTALQTRHLHIVDLDGARDGDQRNRAIVLEIASQTDLCIQLGGGIRNADTLRAWLRAGVDRCVIGSLAATNPDLVRRWIVEFGGDRIVLGMDVNIDSRGTPMLTTHGWTRQTELSLYDSIEAYSDHGLCHILCTDVKRDGAMTGPNLDLYSDLLARFPGLKLQASGGVRHIQDLIDLRERGVPAAITGRALLDGKITPGELVSFLQNA